MELIWILCSALLLSILASFIALLFFSGLITPIDVRVGAATYDELLVAYKTFVGDYSNVGALFTEAFSISTGDLHQIGAYYDDPNVRARDQCRAIVGTVIKGSGASKCKEASEEIKQAYLREGYKLMRLPKPRNVLHTRFPHVTFLSIYLAIWRVYPLLADYLKEKGLDGYGHPFVEIYDGKEIHYFVPLDHHDDFYPPEFSNQKEKEPTTKDEIETEKLVVAPTSMDLDGAEMDTESSASSFEEIDRQQFAADLK